MEETTYYFDEPWDISLFTGTHELTLLLKDSEIICLQKVPELYVQEVK